MCHHRLAVAYSGGRDSTALLHAVLHQAAALGLDVFALHVHHGLHPDADAWLAHAKAQSARWAEQGLPVRFIAHRVTARPAKGDSIEAWARERRYRALKAMADEHEVRLVLLAHHRRDQAETFLLQALRGAGPAGLAAMPRQAVRDDIEWRRPWLDRTRDEIDAYLRRHALAHVDDGSNLDPRFERNRLRLAVWPAFVQAFGDAEAALARAARRAGEADALLDEIAEADLSCIAEPSGLRVDAWRTLTPARRSNALRAWLTRELGAAAPSSLVVRLMHELGRAGSGRWPCERGELRSYRGCLSVSRAPPAAPDFEPSAPAPLPEAALTVQAAGIYRLPGWNGRLRVEHARDAGVPFAWLGRLELRAREGGERFQAGLGRPPRALKKQYQAAAVPAWARAGPLVYSGGQLVFVPGLGLDARVLGLAGQALARLAWLPLNDGA